MKSFDLALCFIIGVLYFSFCVLVVDQLSGRALEDTFWLRDIDRETRDRTDLYVIVGSAVLAVVALVASVHFEHDVVNKGMQIGAVLLTFRATSVAWGHANQLARIAITGAYLAAAVGLAVQYTQPNLSSRRFLTLVRK